jgi:glycosyltransferase involved in cell wall biosynthesis
LKIVFLSPAAQLGGAEAVLLEMLRALQETRPFWSLHVIAAEEGPLLAKILSMDVAAELLPFPQAIRAFGENRRQAPAGTGTAGSSNIASKARRIGSWCRAGLSVLLYRQKLRTRLRRLNPDIVHSNGMKMHLLGALATGPTPLVWHLHDYLSARPAMKPLLRRLANRCRLLIANSESVAADARRVLPTRLPIHTVYNSVDPDVFTPEGPVLDLDELAGLPPAAPGTVRVGLVATFAFWKGHEVFLRAAAACKPSPGIRFYVIGGPVYATGGSQYSLEQLRKIAEELGLGDRVGFTGFVEDVPAAMRALDIVVHASTNPEPFGLVIVQAMACERAVIVSAAAGALELVEPEGNAFVHTPGDVDGLADAISRLVADAKLRQQLGMMGRAAVQRDFTRARMAGALLPLFENAVASGS